MNELVIGDTEFALFARMMKQLTGIHFAPIKKAMVAGRLRSLFKRCEIDSFPQFIERLDLRDPAFIQQTIDLITTNETYFFRESEQFEFIARDWVAAYQPRQALRIWSAACSSGQEVYSLAMAFAQFYDFAKFSILGTDLSSRVLHTARQGVYPLEQAQLIPAAYLKKYCLRGINQHQGTFGFCPELRQRLEFRSANLLDLPNSIGRFDIIFLRNVMIYFEPEIKQQVVLNILQHLNPGGLLVVGNAESLNGINAPVKPLRPALYTHPN